MNKKIMVITSCLMLVILIGVLYYMLKVRPPNKKIYNVGILSALEHFNPIIEGFKQKMTELGYVEGENVFYDFEQGSAPVGNQDIIKKFVDDKVDVILVFPTEASMEAKEVTKGTGIPVVSGAVTTEVSDLVESLQNPGGNITGVRFPVPEVSARRFEILHELVPKAMRFWVPYLNGYPTVAMALEITRQKAEPFHITLIETPFNTPDEMIEYLNTHRDSPEIDAILTISEPLSILPPFMNQVYAFAEERRIPVAGASISETAHGATFSVIPNSFEMGKLAAPMVDKIFKGIPAGTIPIATPELVFDINYKVIQRLGLTANDDLFNKANRIVH